MPITKYAQLRYNALDDCFRDFGRKYFINDLIEYVNLQLFAFDKNLEGVEKRTIQYDLVFFEAEDGFNAPLQRIKDGRKVYYRYSERSFTIKSVALNLHDLDKLKELIELVKDIEGLPHSNWLEQLRLKIYQKGGIAPQDEKIVEFENNPYLVGKDLFSGIHEAIKNHNVLIVKYQSFKNEISNDLVVHPYFLKQYNSRWFLFGWNQDLQKISNLALDRIQSIDYTSDFEYRNSGIEWSYYFEDVIGVSVPEDGEIQTIVLKVSDSLLPYLLTKPLHESQIHSKEKINEIIIKVIPNYELENKILGFGEQVEVKQPLSFKEKISSRVDALKNIYFTSEEEIKNV